MFIVIESIDAAGGSTQAKLLADRLQKTGYDVLSLHFPQEDAPTGQLIYEKFLRNKNKLKLTRREQALLYIQDFFSRAEDIREHLQKSSPPARGGARGGGSSEQFAAQAQAARSLALARQGKTNAELGPREIKQYCRISADTEKIIYLAEQRFHLSGRGVHRLLKVARTIADLVEEENISSRDLAEALQYREQLQAALPEFV